MIGHTNKQTEITSLCAKILSRLKTLKKKVYSEYVKNELVD